MPTNDSGLTARDIVETGDREADLAIQADKLGVRELIAEIEREQLETLQQILDAQTSFGGQGLPAMVSGLESGSGDPARSVEAVYGNAAIDPNPGGAQIFGDAAENIEQLIIRVAQETSGFAGVGRAGLSPVQWRALLQALIWQESRFTIGARSPVGAYGLTQIMPGTASDLGINPEYYDSPYLQVHGGARYLATQLNTFDGNIINALAAYNAGPGR
ncbi:MAG: lytic transglycosylase domain-containing protein, partial [Sulfitobacter sp.]